MQVALYIYSLRNNYTFSRSVLALKMLFYCTVLYISPIEIILGQISVMYSLTSGPHPVFSKEKKTFLSKMNCRVINTTETIHTSLSDPACFIQSLKSINPDLHSADGLFQTHTQTDTLQFRCWLSQKTRMESLGMIKATPFSPTPSAKWKYAR